jgi:peroxiredoxin
MKKTFLLASMLLLSIFGMAQTNYSISGQIKDLPNGKIYLFSMTGGLRIDSAEVNSGKFSMTGKVAEPLFAILVGEDGKYQNPIWLDSVPLALADSASQVQGSDVNKKLAVMLESMGTQNGPSAEKIKEILEENRDNSIPMFFLNYFGRSLDVNYMDQYLKGYTAYDKDPMMQRVRRSLDNLRKSAVGAKAVDFTLNDVKGKPRKFSSFLGKSYVLLDFWASWCGPCRAEMPNVKKAYEMYHKKGFEIVGVSLDSKADAWKNAIKTIGITWPQMSDLKGWKCSASQLYGVDAIPATFLLDKQGVIIARNLRGEELLSKLAELYK